MRIPHRISPVRVAAVLVLAFFLFAAAVPAQQSAKSSVERGPNLATFPSSVSPETLLDPLAPEWAKTQSQRIALNRTPRLYDTEAPSEPEIPYVDVRVVRAEGKLVVQMTWRDSTPDTAQIATLPTAPTEGRPRKELTEATDRFFDSAAVMYPKHVPAEGVWPSLQMGDQNDPVWIYFWSSARGAARMEAAGRGTTARTGETFPARGIYRDGSWHVALELDAVPAGMPVAFAVWNGSQQDRDGRKYFSIWLKLE